MHFAYTISKNNWDFTPYFNISAINTVIVIKMPLFYYKNKYIYALLEESANLHNKYKFPY